MNALLLPLLLAAASAPIEPVPTEVAPTELRVPEMGCGGAPVFADRSPIVEDSAVASVVADPAVETPRADDATVAVVAAERRTDRRCLAETGSRIRGSARRCDAHAGDAYDRADLDRTGAVTTAEALRRLNPSVTIR